MLVVATHADVLCKASERPKYMQLDQVQMLYVNTCLKVLASSVKCFLGWQAELATEKANPDSAF